MNIEKVITRNFLRLQLPAWMLLGLLQRSPIALLRVDPEAFRSSAPIIASLQAMAIAAIAAGPLHAQTGATHFVFSQPNPIQGKVGEPLTVAFTINATPSRANRFFIDDPLPPGLTTIPAMIGNRVASGTPVISGTPTEPGTYLVNVTGSDGFHALGHTLTFEIAGPAQPGRVTQFSILTRLATADPVLTVTTTIDGNTDNAELLVRAAGPSLAPFGLGAPLANPRLELVSGDEPAATNDDWQGDPVLQNAFVRAGAFPFADGSSTDSALIAPAAARTYTARVNAADDAPGIILLEAFVAPAITSERTDARVRNGSLRQQIDVGAPLVLGLVVTGQTPATLSFRVRAESENSVAQLALFDSSGARVPLVNSADDDATRATLPPGSYSLHVRINEGGAPVAVEWTEVP